MKIYVLFYVVLFDVRYCSVSVPKLDLGEQCFSMDVCNDTNAECRQGVCQCIHGSVNEGGFCCKYND